MKFKTIIITRKKIIFALSCAVVTAASGLLYASVGTSSKAVPAFNSAEDIYEDILSKGLPSATYNKFNFKEFTKNITGLDFEKPENIISKYSAAFDKSSEETPIAEEKEQEKTESGEEDISENEIMPSAAPAAEPQLPSLEQINSSAGLALNNATAYDVDLDAMCSEPLAFTADGEGPQVLVIHTHTTECYDGDEMSGETERTTDDKRNVIEVGNVICSTLEEYGIKTYHNTTYHDYPSYQGAYTRALSTINSCLAEYPSIKMVIDVHRDAFVYSDGSKLTVSCEQNGIPTAKVMLVCGSDSMGLEHKNWRENLKLAAKIQNAAEIMYPGLMRPVNLRTERFNMHTTMGSILIEVGSNGNTLDEAKAGGRGVARAIAAVLKNQ